MRRHTRSFLTCTLLAGLLLPVLAQANARLDSQRLNYDRALEAIDKEQWEQFRQLLPGKSYPAAQVGGKVYLEGSALEKLGVRQDFKLAEKVVRLSLGEKSVVRTLRFDSSASPSKGEVFLSRGGAWYPAKEVLQSLSLGYEWNGSSKELAIGKPE